MSATPPNTITVYPIGVKVRIAPDESIQPWPDHLPVPSIGLFEWHQEADGRFRPMIRLEPVWIRMREKVTEELGLGISYNSLRRLMRAGFIRSKQITPGQYSFDLQSYYQHLSKVESDPEFWTGSNLRRYMEAID